MKIRHSYMTGNTTALILVGVSIVALAAGLIGLAISNRSVTQQTEAASMNSQVRLMTVQAGDSGCTQRVSKTGDSSINVCGRICFAQNYQSGGSDTGSLYLTDGTGARVHEGNVSFTFNIASVDFPAPCEYTNRDTGEAELKNGQATKSNLFNIPLSFGSKLSDSYCPDIYVNYRSRVVSGRPFAKISLRDAGLCKPEPTAVPTAQPRQEQPQTTPEPQREVGGKVTGTLSVYSCKKPEFVGIEVCSDENCNETVSLPYNQSTPTAEVENGLWLQDNNTDNTWIYRYSFSKFKGNQLDSNSIYLFKGAHAKIDSPAQPNQAFYYSNREVNQALPVRPGDRQDFTVDAAKTCGCPFNATAYVRSGATGEIIADFDKEVTVYGSANNKQIVDRGDKPVQSSPFKGGQLKVNIPNFVTNVAGSYGEDSLANIKLYAPGYVVTKQKCVSTGSVDACPTYAKSYEKSGDQLGSPLTFENVRVACGVNVEYGWYVLSPTPTPTPTPEVGNVEIRVFSWVDGDTETPSTCSYNQLSSSIGRGGIYKFLGECELELKDSSGKSVVTKELDSYDAEKGRPGCNYHKFENIRPGRYSLRVGGLTSLFNSQCRDARDFEVKAGETVQVPAIFSVDLDKCDPRHLTETTCSNCQDAGGRCLTRYQEGSNSRLCCVGGGGSDGGDGGGGGGQGECSTDKGLHCTGSAADNPRYANNPQARCDDAGLGQAYGWCGAGNNACCYAKGSGGGGNPGGDPGNPGGDPGNPEDPGNGGDTGDFCATSGDDFFYLDSSCPADSEVGAAGCAQSQCTRGGYSSLHGTDYYCCNVGSNPGDNPGETPKPGSSKKTCRERGYDGPFTLRSTCENARYKDIVASEFSDGFCCKNRDTSDPLPAGCTAFDTHGACIAHMLGHGGICTPWNNKYKFCPINITPPTMSKYKMNVSIESAAYFQPLRTKLKLCRNSENCESLFEGDIRDIPVLTDFNRTFEKERIAGDQYYLACDFRSYNGVNTSVHCTCHVNLTPNGEDTINISQMGSSMRGPVTCSQGFTDTQNKEVTTTQMDLDGNGIINTLDMAILKDAYASFNTPASQNVSSSQNPDINDDGKVNALDLSYLINAFGLEVVK